MGSLLVLPRQLRRVPVAADFRTHLDAAATLGFPMDARLRASALPDDAACAVATAVSYGGRRDAARRAAVGTLKPIADRWRAVSIASSCPPPCTASPRGSTRFSRPCSSMRTKMNRAVQLRVSVSACPSATHARACGSTAHSTRHADRSRSQRPR
eukprot:1485378-Prymnesium_polylepis.1